MVQYMLIVNVHVCVNLLFWERILFQYLASNTADAGSVCGSQAFLLQATLNVNMQSDFKHTSVIPLKRT